METVFTSPNIRFVRPSEALVSDYLAMVNDWERVGRLIGSRRDPFTEQQERQWVRKKLAEGKPVFSMLERDTDAFIGTIEFIDVADGSAELGIAITASMQDRGYGTEAVRAMVDYGMDALGFHRIFLKVFPDNARAIHVYEKCGFRKYDRTEDDVFMEIRREADHDQG